MANKTNLIQVRVSEKQKAQIDAAAKAEDVKVPEYILNALDFYAGFDVHFLEHIYATAQKMKLPIPTVIQQLLVAYINADAAIMEGFGTGGQTYRRAFQYDETGLIEGSKHGELVYEQVKEEISALRKKIENAVKAKKPVLITREDAALIAARL